MKKPTFTFPKLNYSELIMTCPYCGKKVDTRDVALSYCFSTSIRKVTTYFHYKCMIRRNHEILQHKAN